MKRRIKRKCCRERKRLISEVEAERKWQIKQASGKSDLTTNDFDSTNFGLTYLSSKTRSEHIQQRYAKEEYDAAADVSEAAQPTDVRLEFLVVSVRDARRRATSMII